MRFKLLFALGFVINLCYSNAVRAEDKPDPRETLETTIAEIIRLIEAKDTVGMIKTFIPPKELQRQLENKTIEEMVKDLEPRRTIILKMLKHIQGTKPQMNNIETEATYELKEPIDGVRKVTFGKVEKLWYVR